MIRNTAPNAFINNISIAKNGDRMKKTKIRVRIPPHKIEEVIRLLEIVRGRETGLVLDHRFIERVKGTQNR